MGIYAYSFVISLCFVQFILISTPFVQVDSSGDVIVFKRSGCPWKEHLFDIEEELKISDQIKFVLYQDQNHNWRVQVGLVAIIILVVLEQGQWGTKMCE